MLAALFITIFGSDAPIITPSRVRTFVGQALVEARVGAALPN